MSVVLPYSLLILVHLHLLNYPLKDASGYDDRLFDPTRGGIRERTRAMEDICYFLVGQVEGGRERARSLLPMYPCLQPSDTTAFRISLSKYLESLRHNIIHPCHAEGKKISDNEKHQGRQTIPPASWWKDVVVRKSLLEECCGERFERLILALSTHALFKSILKLAGSPSRPSLAESSQYVLGNQSNAYITFLNIALSARRSWERSASVLVRRAQDLVILRAQLSDQEPQILSRYSNFSTDRLNALLESKHNDLLRKLWNGEDGPRSLHFLIDLVGLQGILAGTQSSISPESQPTLVVTPDTEQIIPSASTIPSLPITAAHHPTHLQSLDAPLFVLSAPPSIQTEDDQIPKHKAAIPLAVSERLEAAKYAQQSLQHALAYAERLRKDTVIRLRKVKAAPVPADASQESSGLGLNLWTASDGNKPNFNTAPISEFLATFSLPAPPSESALEERIARIRSELPSYTLASSSPPSDTSGLSTPEALPVVESVAPVNCLRKPLQRENRSLKPTDVKSKIAVHSQAGPPVKSSIPRFVTGDTGNSKAMGEQPSAHDAVALDARRISRKITRRASAAKTRRSTTFAKRDPHEEVDRIVEAFEDGSPSLSEGTATPKCTSMTIGVPLSTVKKSTARPSFDIERHERAIPIPLPRLRLSEMEEHDIHADSPIETPLPNHEEEPLENTSSSTGQRGLSSTDDDDYGGHSITLRDILLKAGSGDTVEFDLLADGEGPEDEEFEWG
ncbi:uncharacterized protein FIBRA_04724 [Fibroporia radiculosa]|uniref:HAUS augmin-like complex subunit 6 N-terminal domain-containing protein n=1 Tax=Fibroporia radiculosa TaxID=599839 RepID=J4IAB5_9APHY|nr:uncharacterized protein FIBRA_04724 [Fibroporia radiculosa]CCM02621.1 predicted protein [Fibroporia radiculosa]